jgi:ABC-type sugar transport system ATPase subunit
MSAPVVEALGLTKRYGSTAALSDVTMRVLPGESHALVGRNGAGKSTLVSMITGLRRPDAGEIRFGGEPAPPLADRDGWRERVACVYQHSTIIRELSVAENLFINRQHQRGGVIDWRTMRRSSSRSRGRCRMARASSSSTSLLHSWTATKSSVSSGVSKSCRQKVSLSCSFPITCRRCTKSVRR